MMQILDLGDFKIYSFSFCIFKWEIAFDLRISDNQCRKTRMTIKHLNKRLKEAATC